MITLFGDMACVSGVYKLDKGLRPMCVGATCLRIIGGCIVSFGSCGDRTRWHDSLLERAYGVHVCEVENVVASLMDQTRWRDCVNVVVWIMRRPHEVA